MAKIAKAITTGKVDASLSVNPERNASLTAIILKEAGIDLSSVADVLARCLTAKKRVSLEETEWIPGTKEPKTTARGDVMNTRRIHIVDDYDVQHKTAQTILNLLTPKSESPQVGQMNIIVPQVPDEMLSLRGEALQKAYMDRVRAIANDLPPPPLENYREKTIELAEESNLRAAEGETGESDG